MINIMLTYLAMADHFKPKWLLWENVPGVLSSNRGHDFAALLQGMAQCGYGFAYRVLDAQYFGVPQRRRRVFVVGCLGDWRSAAKVLFESESLCRDITPSRGEGQEVANCLTKSPSSHSGFNPASHEGNGVVWPAPIASTLNASFGDKQGLENQHINQGAPLFVADIAPTITTKGGGTASGPSLMANMRVRRLTPKECERLQGFPDEYTNILNAPDAGRYKALGNSMAVPVMRWIGERINDA